MNPRPIVVVTGFEAERIAVALRGLDLTCIRNPDFARKIAELDKSKTYLVHCRSGVRSVTACNALGELGIPNLYNMLGGINAWTAAGKPVEK